MDTLSVYLYQSQLWLLRIIWLMIVVYLNQRLGAAHSVTFGDVSEGKNNALPWIAEG